MVTRFDKNEWDATRHLVAKLCKDDPGMIFRPFKTKKSGYQFENKVVTRYCDYLGTGPK